MLTTTDWPVSSSSVIFTENEILTCEWPRVDLDTFLEENRALAPGGKRQLEEWYRIATADRFGFLAVNMMTKDKSKIFMKSLHSFLFPS